jgi:type IV secretory pathway VirB2 component (pilin)
MARVGLLIGAMLLALVLAIVSLQTPRPLPADAPPTQFSAARAMVDIREIARNPHPVGSADHARVRDLLLLRMNELGLTPETQTGVLSPAAVRRLERDARPEAASAGVTNLIGMLPGRDREAAPLLLMAHYDTVPGSPGAADDTTGVAAILEIVRALRARGETARDVVVLFTDAEELNLDGARVFFSEHPLRDRIGAVINLEARGGGGRAMMFETGRGNGETVALLARAAPRATGGVSSNALAVVVYENMPNGTDFTVSKDRGIGGLNFAFIGRPSHYHSPVSTPETLDEGSVQHIGSQALEAADLYARAPALPAATPNVVYADIFGKVFIRHAPIVGWGLWALAAGLTGFAAWRARRGGGLTLADIGRGALSGVWLVGTGIVLTQAARVLAGPMTGRIGSADAYYTLLRRLPWMEAGAALAVLAAALLLLGGRAAVSGRALALILALGALLAFSLGGFSPIIAVAAVLAIGLSLWPRGKTTPWGGWLGLIGLVLLLAAPAQAIAPEAAFLLIWPALAGAVAAAIAALIDPRLMRWTALIPAALLAVLTGGWLLGLGHGVYLGIGMDLPGALALIALLMLLTLRPLAASARFARPMAIGAAISLVLALGVSGAARVIEPERPATTA